MVSNDHDRRTRRTVLRTIGAGSVGLLTGASTVAAVGGSAAAEPDPDDGSDPEEGWAWETDDDGTDPEEGWAWGTDDETEPDPEEGWAW